MVEVEKLAARVLAALMVPARDLDLPIRCFMIDHMQSLSSYATVRYLMIA